MSPLLWMLTGAGVLLAFSVVMGMIIDERVRRDVGAALLGAVVLPVMVPVTILLWVMDRGGPGLHPLSPRTLARFANQRQREDIDRYAWMFSLGSHGVILIRKRPRPAAATNTGEEDTDD